MGKRKGDGNREKKGKIGEGKSLRERREGVEGRREEKYRKGEVSGELRGVYEKENNKKEEERKS